MHGALDFARTATNGHLQSACYLVRVNLSTAEWLTLKSMARKYTRRYCDVIRVIAAHLETPRQIVSKWANDSLLRDCLGLRQRRCGR
jgi:hypothetical protein